MDENIDNSHLGPGGQLKQAREAKGFSLSEVAKALHYKTSLVEQIEADDYSDMRSETFARGYLKAYAKYLNVPADDIIVGFEQFRRRPQGLRTAQANNPTGRTARRRTYRDNCIVRIIHRSLPVLLAAALSRVAGVSPAPTRYIQTKTL